MVPREKWAQAGRNKCRAAFFKSGAERANNNNTRAARGVTFHFFLRTSLNGTTFSE
jgi:hypothetical protein